MDKCIPKRANVENPLCKGSEPIPVSIVIAETMAAIQMRAGGRQEKQTREPAISLFGQNWNADLLDKADK